MRDPFREALLQNGRHLQQLVEACSAHAAQLDQQGRSAEAAVYRHCAQMGRRVHSGNPPTDLHDTLKASIAIFTGISRNN